MRVRKSHWPRIALLAAVLALLAAPAWANVYASGLAQTGSMSLSYVLNEKADAGLTMQVWQVGGGMVYSEAVGFPNKGTHNWTWDGTGYVPGNAYKVKAVASSSGYGGWTQISTDQTSTSFYSPVGVSVNKLQSSANFGKTYVSNAVTGTTAYGRATPEGIYALNADCSEAGFSTGGVAWGGTSGPWKSTIGPDGHLYVVDLSNDLVHELSDDLSSATQLIGASNRTTNQWVGGVHVSGTQAGGDRAIYLVDSNYNDTARKGLIAYHLGGNAAATPGDTGEQYIGPSYFAFYPYDVARDSAGDWYMCQYRYDPTQAPAISKFLDGAPPINTAQWETAKTAPYNGACDIDIYEPYGWIAYGNYYDGFVRIFSMSDGSYVGGFDAGTRMRSIAFDAAGNIVTVDNMTEWMRVWSPAGTNTFTTESWFAIPEPSSFAALLIGLPLIAFRRRK